MARVLTDTNIWLRVVDPGAVHHANAVEAVAHLLTEGHEVCLCPQNLIEFWAVATRPVDANGLGWSVENTAAEIANLETRFTCLPDTPDILGFWKRLVQGGAIRGKRTHDARLAAVYLSHRAQALLTFNRDDFAAFTELRLLDPRQIQGWDFPATQDR